MTPARLHLTDSDLLRKLMLWAPGGKPITVAELAAKVGVSRTKIYALLDGTRPTVDPQSARLIARTVGVHQEALFVDSTPTPMGVGATPTTEEPPHDHH